MSAVPLLRKTLRSCGVDRAIAYTVLGRGWSVVTGPATLFFIIKFLSPQEQGFYYTFGSILGLQIFFEMGLSSAVVLFASHEKARLEWTPQGTLEGDPTAKTRLASLLRMALMWYGIVALLFTAVVLPVGWYFFQTHQPQGEQVVWLVPWVWVVLVQTAGLVASPLFGVLEGCGLVAEIARLRVIQNVVGGVTTWAVLLSHWGLYAAPVLNTVSLLSAVLWLVLAKRPLVVDLLAQKHSAAAFSWSREVWPFQWRIALSSVSGYFAFLLFNPVLFAYHGATAAGRLGMSASVMGSMAAMAIAWVSTKTSPFGALIAKKEYEKLDKLFFPALWQSFLLIALGGLAFWGAAYYLHCIHHHFSLRLLEPLPLALLIGTVVLNHVVGAEAIYLRAHKEEPFLTISIILGVMVGASTYLLGKPFGAIGMMAGYFLINLIVGLGAGTWIFLHKRRLWQGQSPLAFRPLASLN